MTAFHRLTEAAAAGWAELVLLDLGPNLGAINRAALIASHAIALPLAPDLYSLQGLRNLGPTLRDWRRTWAELKPKAPQDLSLPDGSMEPAGYVVMGHGILDRRPVKASQRWMDRIPPVYRTSVRDEPLPPQLPKVADDPYCLSQLKHSRSLMPVGTAFSNAELPGNLAGAGNDFDALEKLRRLAFTDRVEEPEQHELWNPNVGSVNLVD